MADLRISELPVLLPADVEAGDDLAVADYSASETRKSTVKGVVQKAVSSFIDNGVIPGSKLVADSVTAAQLAPNAVGVNELADNSVDTASIVDLAVTNSKLADGIDGTKILAKSISETQIGLDAVTAYGLADGAVDTPAIQDGAVTNAKVAAGISGAKLLANSVTAVQIAPDSITASELADNSVDTQAVADGAITNVKLATGIDGAKLNDGSIVNSKLAAGIDGAKLLADSVTAAQIGPNAISASELADGAVDTTALQDGAVTNTKLATGIDGAKLLADSVTAAQIAPNAITSSELADLSVGTVALQDSAVTDAKVAAGISGAKLSDATVTDAKLAAGIDGAKLTAGSVSGTQLGAVTNRGLDQSGGKIGHTNAVTPGTRNGITYDAAGHITGTVALSSTDLPIATATTVGAVSVPLTSGLSVALNGSLDHINNITGGSVSGLTIDKHGHISNYRPLTGSDLPAATSTTIGAMSVPTGFALTVNGAGQLSHQDSTVTAGTYSKVTVDQRGHVTSGMQLSAVDVPALDASTITTGTFSTDRLADRSITALKLADYATALIQEAVPVAGVGSHPIGMIWLQESTGQVSVWNGNSWMKTGASFLFNHNLRYAGSYNPATGLVTGVTQFGTAEGFKVSDPIPTADDKLAGTYFVASGSGSSGSIAGGVAFDPGDWLLCHGAAGGWVRIDTLSGAGGGIGSSVNNLDDLLDVTLTAPSQGDVLQMGASGQWVNVSVLDEGTWT